MATPSAEETALLGVVSMDAMDDIELRNVQLQLPCARRLSAPMACAEVRVRTDRGDLLVAVSGDSAKPAILTYHDIGLNYLSFAPFFNYVDMRALLENFCVYHVNAPGQEDGAPTLPDDYEYPSMEELASQLNYVLGHFGIKSFIGFGVGAGANVLARFALLHPEKVDALALVNCTARQAGWIEWAYHKVDARTLRTRGLTPGVVDNLVWHHLGRSPEERNHDLASVYRSLLSGRARAANLAAFAEAYARRSELGLAREGRTLAAPALLLTGALSPHLDETVAFNARLNPNISTWMKISDCASVLDEQPGKVSEAFRLFLQGEGYVAPLSPSKIVLFRRLSDAAEAARAAAPPAAPAAPARRARCRLSPVIRITENPISEAVVC